MDEIALKVEELSKEYRLGTIGYGTMREDLQTWWAHLRGKEDPNSLVTASHHSESEQKHFLALDDINFEIKKGDRVGIIGRNGAGKSTLLKILSRITSPTKGNIYINGRIGSLLEVGTGFHQELTGRENIYLNGSILGMRKREIDKKLDEIVDFSGIEKFIDTPVKRYSSGMFVRLGFAVAAHLEPEILIVDEVLAVGDAEFQKKAIGKMEDVSNNEGRTVLFVSHNMGSVRQLCNKGILLNQGQLSHIGSIDEVITNYLNVGEEDNSYYHNVNTTNKDVELIEVFIEDNHRCKKSSFENSNNHKLVCNYRINQQKKGLVVSVEFYNSKGICVFCSTSMDDYLDNYNQNIFNEGYYSACMNLPLEILRDDIYTINVFITIPNIETLVQAENCISFRIEDIISPVAISGEGRRGEVLPIIHWEQSRIND